MSECIEVGCQRPSKSRQLCERHYKQRRYRGEELPPRVRAENVGKPCSTPNCPRKAMTSGLCPACYAQMKRTGSVERQRIVGDILGRMWQHSIITDAGCWEWQAKADQKGYPRIQTNSGYQGMHIASYDFHVGERPDGWQVHHLCWNKRCWNPAHLVAVTPAHHALIHRWSEQHRAAH
jgi:hypothetical protein